MEYFNNTVIGSLLLYLSGALLLLIIKQLVCKIRKRHKILYKQMSELAIHVEGLSKMYKRWEV